MGSLQIWLREGPRRRPVRTGPVTDLGKREELLKLLNRLGIRVKDKGSGRFEMIRFAYEEADLGQIAKKVEDAVDKLANSDGSS